MLDAIKSSASGNQIEIKITGKQGSKADGHNNHSGKSQLPARKFIPDGKKGETYSRTIIEGIRTIIDDAS